MKKNILFYLCLLLCYFFFNNLALADLNEGDYKKAAENFLAYQGSNKKIISEEILRNDSIVIGYVMGLEKGGYILVPATEFLPPVKAYSLKTDFKTLPPWYIKFLTDELSILQSIKTGTARINAQNANTLKWDFLLNYNGKSSREYTPGNFLLKTKWGQGYPYNKMMPEIEGKNVVTGCMQTALAQLMKYHEYPGRVDSGIAIHNLEDQKYKAVLYKNYHWENIPEVLDTNAPEYIQDELALIIRDLAIVNKTDFGNGSETLNNLRPFVKYFGYGVDFKELKNDDENLFFNEIKNEIENNRPVMLCLPGHGTIADGYNTDQTGNSIHINMGWDGHDDDFYYLNNTEIKTTQFIFPITPPNLKIMYNVKPCTSLENNCYEDLVELESDDSISGSNIRGKINSENDIDDYAVYLKGMTSITGANGFYIILYNSAGELLDSSDSSINQNLPADKYIVKISLESEDGYHIYNELDNDYAVAISSESLTNSEINTIENQDESPVIYNEFKDLVITEENRIRINAVDPDGDTLILSAYGSTQDVNVSFDNDILTITPGAEKGYSRITIKAGANNKETEKTFTVLVNNEKIYWGKEFTINGQFENQEDINQYPVLLDGACTIYGDRGFLEQYFYISVKDMDENDVVNPIDDSFTNTFTSGMYNINSSLSLSPFYYPYSPEFSNYSIFVSCPDSSFNIKDIADILGIDMSVIPGDINHQDGVNLQDVILALKISAKIPVESSVYIDADVNNDHNIGLQEAIYGIKLVAEVQQ